jgi:hypothetical protein
VQEYSRFLRRGGGLPIDRYGGKSRGPSGLSFSLVIFFRERVYLYLLLDLYGY